MVQSTKLSFYVIVQVLGKAAQTTKHGAHFLAMLIQQRRLVGSRQWGASGTVLSSMQKSTKWSVAGQRCEVGVRQENTAPRWIDRGQSKTGAPRHTHQQWCAN